MFKHWRISENTLTSVVPCVSTEKLLTPSLHRLNFVHILKDTSSNKAISCPGSKGCFGGLTRRLSQGGGQNGHGPLPLSRAQDSGRGLRRALARQMSRALGVHRTRGTPRTMKPWGGGPSAARAVGSRCCRSRAPNCTPRGDPDLLATERRRLRCILRPSNWNDAAGISRPSPTGLPSHPNPCRWQKRRAVSKQVVRDAVTHETPKHPHGPRVLLRTPGSREVGRSRRRGPRGQGGRTGQARPSGSWERPGHSRGDTEGAAAAPPHRGGPGAADGASQGVRVRGFGPRSAVTGHAALGRRTRGERPFRRLRLGSAPRKRPRRGRCWAHGLQPRRGSDGGGAATGTSARPRPGGAHAGSRGWGAPARRGPHRCVPKAEARASPRRARLQGRAAAPGLRLHSRGFRPQGAGAGLARALGVAPPGGLLRALIPATRRLGPRPPGPCFAARTRAARQGRGTRCSSHGLDPRGAQAAEERRGRRAASACLQAAAVYTATSGSRGGHTGVTRKAGPCWECRAAVLVGPRGPLRQGGLPRRPQAGTGGRPGGRPEADGAAGRARHGLRAQVPPSAKLEVETACSLVPAPAVRPRSCSAGPARKPGLHGVSAASPAAAPEPEPSRGDLAGTAVGTASRGKPALPGPGQQEAPRLPGGLPPHSANEKPPPSPAANEKPPPHSAREKPPPPSNGLSFHTAPPTPFHIKEFPARQHFPACESSSPAWEAENPVAPSPEEAVNTVTCLKSLKSIFVGYVASEATGKEFCSSKTISCLLRSQFSSDVDLGFAGCNPPPGFPDKTPSYR
ncbi:unnamed protein product [Nyctereutes procyonoides]|uniref:(raccoon dog) hypothetical protein n=1 Tax=Nyctereutes procyonoides TaxID=34880 RepID=A0A811YCF9_NYCPR|nr:unnamed protein product [Nyctereutes procyonoides]